jgi:radical SAM/Cys-rich protein
VETARTAETKLPIEPFRQTLGKHGLNLSRGKTTTLQINVGLLCNQSCSHCHLEAGPHRHELMNDTTVDQVVELAKTFPFEVTDITGGAPEMNPHIASLIEKLSPLTPRLMLRSNLTALNHGDRAHLVDIYKQHRVVIIASFPSFNETQAESQRGTGTFHQTIDIMKKLNSVGYGTADSGLELNLVINPTGAFLPSSQDQVEKRFRQVLETRWGIVFSNIFTFANVPLGRFRQWLERSGNLDSYLEKLASNFNSCAVEGLMCRSMISVSWDGYLYDCDFNQAKGLYLGGRKTHISELKELPEPGKPIAISYHCYTCTAGAGFT